MAPRPSRRAHGSSGASRACTTTSATCASRPGTRRPPSRPTRRSLAVQADDAPTWANLATALRLAGDPVRAGGRAQRPSSSSPASALGRAAVTAAVHGPDRSSAATADALELVRRWVASSTPTIRAPGTASRPSAACPCPTGHRTTTSRRLFDAAADDFDPHLAGLPLPRARARRRPGRRGSLGRAGGRRSTSPTSGAARASSAASCGPGRAPSSGATCRSTCSGRRRPRLLRRAAHGGARRVPRAQPRHTTSSSCADTLCYLGDLGRRWRRRAARCGRAASRGDRRAAGRRGAEPWRLTPSGRYAHRQEHLRDGRRAAGLVDVEVTPVHLRLEAGEPVEGLLWSARRPGGPPKAHGPDRGRQRRERREGWAGRGGLTRTNACG